MRDLAHPRRGKSPFAKDARRGVQDVEPPRVGAPLRPRLSWSGLSRRGVAFRHCSDGLASGNTVSERLFEIRTAVLFTSAWLRNVNPNRREDRGWDDDPPGRTVASFESP